tara:strand:+ start:56 stop:385 length:330 start_codon:yes stop_codon:yes gene_type:complete
MDTTSVGKLALYGLKQGIKSVGYLFSRLFHWKKKDFITLGTVIVGTFALSTIDDGGSALFLYEMNLMYLIYFRKLVHGLGIHRFILQQMQRCMVLAYSQKMKNSEKRVF